MKNEAMCAKSVQLFTFSWSVIADGFFFNQ